MNLDERIIELEKKDYYAMGASAKSAKESRRADIKQLLRDVLKYVKPEKLNHGEALLGILPDLPDHDLEMFDRGYNKSIRTMESKQKELGL